MQIKITLTEHCDINNNKINDIIAIKQQHWSYSYNSQIEWIKNNLDSNDIHVCVEMDDELIAYLNLSKVKMYIDNVCVHALGVGNVCVGKSHLKKGWGALMMSTVNTVIKETNQIGVLLCNPQLVPFYKKSGWNLIENIASVTVAGKKYEDCIMLYNYNEAYVADIKLDRNF